MSNDEKQVETKKRGRPPLSDEERKLRQRESQKKYCDNNQGKILEKGRRARAKYSEVKLLVLREYRPIIDKIAIQKNTTITELFLNAFEEKYDVKLTSKD